ncbi:MAG: bifunctional diaminohydroxyphosphoribosylaminopyrimidine deaminase/5-amino-6-(5-phosphoribosylamino)uracil reductase RibD [Betaproteobacteria bacterium]|nr:bifunctional diaminohydroxyphosphoribosylaminopyrimidine deaminase/5-amino-6-(5-phosphoribosylamino)uracil reductase RibD [Betaproteobacteria bacterium]
MNFSAADHAHMARALQLAAHGLYTTTPNPRVGCVIVREERIVGEGWHARAGEPHAEVHALRMAGESARGATAYVTLEPCSHFGRTPPCTEALIQAGVARVVAAMQDPNPRVAGSGLARLAAQGIDTACGLLEQEARELNRGFIQRMLTGRPWVQLKLAASVDGRTALANGESKWITGPDARRDVQRWRARSCAILTGSGTVLADDPQLNVREIETSRQPLRVIADSKLSTPPGARILQGGQALIACADAFGPRAEALRNAGAELFACPNANGQVSHPNQEVGVSSPQIGSAHGADDNACFADPVMNDGACAQPVVNLPALLTELGRRGVNELMVEAGAKLAGAMLATGCVNEILLYLAPALMGNDARGLIALSGLESMADVPRFAWHEVHRVGTDLRLILRPSV